MPHRSFGICANPPPYLVWPCVILFSEDWEEEAQGEDLLSDEEVEPEDNLDYKARDQAAVVVNVFFVVGGGFVGVDAGGGVVVVTSVGVRMMVLVLPYLFIFYCVCGVSQVVPPTSSCMVV